MKRLCNSLVLIGTITLLFGCSDEGGTTADTAMSDSDVAETNVADSSVETGLGDTAEDSAGPDDSIQMETDTAPAGPLDLYDERRFLQVEITMSPADLEVMRLQTRTLLDILGPTCLEGPPVRPFTWFPATAIVDGVAVTNVGVRKKGFFGSLDPIRPSLKLKFDAYVDDQEFEGASRMTLNNVRQDPTRFNTCLAYSVFRAAGVPTPRCNFAHVTVNGFDLGVYVHVESIKKAFLRRVFEDDDGDLYEGALSDFRDGWNNTFDKKTNENAPDSGIFDRVAAAIAGPDETLLESLDAVMDLDGFFVFWAAEVLVAHWDGYAGNTNNFYIYHDLRDDRLRFIPWGPDATFRPRQGAGGGDPAASVVVASGVLTSRLYAHPEGRARYRAALTKLLIDVWDSDALLDTVTRWDALTVSTRLPGTISAATDALAVMRAFVSGRRGQIFSALQNLPDETPPLRDSPCLVPRGSIAGTFDTTWGTLSEENIFMTGEGSMTLTDSDFIPVFNLFGSKVGVDPEAPGRVALQVAGRMVDSDYLIFAASFDESTVLAGATIPLNFVEAEAYVYYLTPTFEGSLAGFVGDGAVTFEAADQASGAAVTGTFQGVLYGGE